MENRYHALSYRDIENLLAKGMDTALLPIGAVEQHGAHCALGTDSLIARVISLGLAEKLNALSLPPVWYGMSRHHMDFAGSISIRTEVLSGLIEDILRSLAHHGFKNMVILNGHGGNNAAMETATMNLRQDYPGLWIASSNVWLALADIYEELPETARSQAWTDLVAHGGLLETSVVMAIDEGMVDLGRIKSGDVGRLAMYGDATMKVTLDQKTLRPGGSGGDPSKASPELGRLFVEKSVDMLAEKFHTAREAFIRYEG